MLRYYDCGPVRTFLWEGSTIARSTPEGWRDMWLDTPVCYGVQGMVECLRERPPLIAMEIRGRDRDILEESAAIAGRWRFELAFTERSGDIGLFRIVPR